MSDTFYYPDFAIMTGVILVFIGFLLDFAWAHSAFARRLLGYDDNSRDPPRLPFFGFQALPVAIVLYIVAKIVSSKVSP